MLIAHRIESREVRDLRGADVTRGSRLDLYDRLRVQIDRSPPGRVPAPDGLLLFAEELLSLTCLCLAA
jgi:hypothetical protein